MQNPNPSADIGIIVGRFQVHKLHEAHRDLIQTVQKNHKRVVVFLGVARIQGTRNNPLGFDPRKQMILGDFPDVTVLPLNDQRSDKLWAKDLDTQLHSLYPNNSFMLYGSRDSFTRIYGQYGKLPITELEPEVYVSGTKLRNEAFQTMENTESFRAGIIHAVFNRYPMTGACVDVAVRKDDQVLLCRKPGEKLFRFIGGFKDRKDKSYEAAGKREVMEEAHAEVGDLRYVGSMNVDDWRYRGEIDGITTVFYEADFVSGKLEPDDDIEELRWFKLSDLTPDMVEFEHSPLVAMLQEFNATDGLAANA